MKSIGNPSHSFYLFALLYCFCFHFFLIPSFFPSCFSIVFSFHISYISIYYAYRRNQKSHVSTNLVHKLFRIQNIAAQPVSYFEKLVSKEDLAASDAKQKSKNRTWFTLTVEALNGVLYQVL